MTQVEGAARRLDWIALDAIEPADRNPKRHDDELIGESIGRFGFVETPVIDERTGKLVAGHGRTDDLRRRRDAGEAPPDGIALGHEGEWLVPVLRGWSSRDDQDALAAGIALNRVGEAGGWDWQELHDVLAQFDGEAFVGVGFDAADLDRILEQLAEQEPPPPASTAERVKLTDRFLVPPFSVLDARQGYWQDRKREWLGLGIRSELGRPRNLLKFSDTVLAATESRQGTSQRTTGADRPEDDQHDRDSLRRDWASGDGHAGALRIGQPNRSRPQTESGGLDIGFMYAKTAMEEKLGRKLSTAEFIADYYEPPNRSKPSDSGNDPLFYWKKQEAEKAAGRELTTAEFLAEWYEGPDAYIEGTSIFDPVLAELAYRWFSPPGARVLDPFAGGSVRGIVASRLERAYVGIDLSADQVAANEEQRAAICRERDPQPEWVTGDARHVAQLVDGEFDFLFSCPPYFNLERYSDAAEDLSNAGSWDDFQAAYTAIIGDACARLRPGRFACFVIGNVREENPTGALLDLGACTARAFEQAGLIFYNDAILVTALGSLAIRAARVFKSRKLGRTHQQVLVFLKPPLDEALAACGPTEIADPAEAFGQPLEP